MVTIEKLISTVTTTRVVVSGPELRTLLGLPENSKLVVCVPGGGDWSDTDLDLDDHPVVITVEEMKVGGSHDQVSGKDH